MESGSSGGRAAAAFGAIGLIIVTLGINISANSISAANDLMAFAPKYIDIRRGQLLAAFIGSWAFVPWKILASAATFLAFLGGYTIFLGPMTSILMCDYFIVRRGNVSVPDMYNFHGMYRYSPKFATNWRSVVAFAIGCVPPLPGFINNIVKAGGDKTTVSAGGQNLYVYSPEDKSRRKRTFANRPRSDVVSLLATSTPSLLPASSTGALIASFPTGNPRWTMLRPVRRFWWLRMLRMWRLVVSTWLNTSQAYLAEPSMCRHTTITNTSTYIKMRYPSFVISKCFSVHR
jgi:hypothetical protein